MTVPLSSARQQVCMSRVLRDDLVTIGVVSYRTLAAQRPLVPSILGLHRQWWSNHMIWLNWFIGFTPYRQYFSHGTAVIWLKNSWEGQIKKNTPLRNSARTFRSIFNGIYKTLLKFAHLSFHDASKKEYKIGIDISLNFIENWIPNKPWFHKRIINSRWTFLCAQLSLADECITVWWFSFLFWGISFHSQSFHLHVKSPHLL